MLILSLILWYIVGFFSITYTLLKTGDVLVMDLPYIAIASAFGPIPALVTTCITMYKYSRVSHVVVFSKRKK